MRINFVFGLLATCICLAVSPSFAMDPPLEGLDAKKIPLVLQVTPTVLMGYDRNKITTLAVGVRLIESQIHFFGGERVYNGTHDGFGRATINFKGESLSDRDKKNGLDKDIPQIILNDERQVVYTFQENGPTKPYLRTTDKQQALLRQNRQFNSFFCMETHPKETIYLDLHPIPRCGEGHGTTDLDYVHLAGDIQKINCLPEGQKVNKIVIEYLGDDLYGYKDFEMLDWNWLKNLHGLLNREGQVLFEMRADGKTAQDKAPALDELSPELEKAKTFIESMVSMAHSSKSIAQVHYEYLQHFRTNPYIVKKAALNRKLTHAETDLIAAHLGSATNLPKPHVKITGILKEKFKKSGFNTDYDSIFVEKHTRMPTRFYDTVIIKATIN